MNKKTIIYSICAGFLALLNLVFGAHTAQAQYYNSYYNSTTSYPYQYSYDTYTNSNYGNFGYSAYQNSSQNYSNYNQTCPGGFTVTAQGYLLSCNKNIGSFGSNYNGNVGYGSVLGASTTLVPGCFPGYIFSTLTGRRCDSFDSYNSNYYYNNGSISGTDASIEDFEMRDGDDTTVEEDDNDAELAEVRFDVEDGDIRLDRAEFDFEYTGNSGGNSKPWEIFDEIRLLSDGHEIDSMSVDSKSDWDEEDNDTYTLTFTNLDEIIRENDHAKLTIEADVSSNINGSGFASWKIFVPDRGIRAQDGGGRTVYTGDDDEDVSIDVEN